MRRSSVLLIVEQLRRTPAGGIGTYVRGLLRGLSQLQAETSGLEAPWLTLYASRSPSREDPLAALGHPIVTSALPGPMLTEGWLWGVSDVPKGFELVHATSLASPPSGHGTLVVTVHDLAFRSVPEAFPTRGRHWHERAWRNTLQRAEALVVPSDQVAETVSAAGATRSAVHVIPHGSDHLPPPDETGADAVLARLRLRGPFLLSVGTIEPRKNLPRLLDAYARARGQLDDVSLVVVGPSGWGPLSSEDRVRPGVHLAGAVSAATLAALYRRARGLVFVPLTEGFGLPVLEAMACGAPVLCSPVPSADEAALVVDPVDVEEMSQGMIRLCADEVLRQKLSEAGRHHASEHTWANSASAHVRLWDALS